MAGNPHPKPFAKTGAAANPNGRPKKEWTFKGLIEDALEEQNEKKIPYKKILMYKLRELGLKGDIAAIKEIMNRLDGMPTQKQEISGKDGDPLSINIIAGNGYISGSNQATQVPDRVTTTGQPQIQSGSVAQEKQENHNRTN